MKKKSNRKSKASARKYDVKAALANTTLTRAKSALTLQIYDNERRKLGELQIGRGSLYWWGAHKQKSKRVGWGKFAEQMNALAYGE